MKIEPYDRTIFDDEEFEEKHPRDPKGRFSESNSVTSAESKKKSIYKKLFKKKNSNTEKKSLFIDNRQNERLHNMTEEKKFDKENFSSERKDNAVRALTRTESKNKFESSCENAYKMFDNDEKISIYSYTESNYYQINDTIFQSNGEDFESTVEKVILADDKTCNQIDRITSALDKTTSEKDAWVYRVTGSKTIAGLFHDYDTPEYYSDVKRLDDILSRGNVDELVDYFNGKESDGVNKCFMSCTTSEMSVFAAAKGSVHMNIFCPKGTNMLYIDGKSKYPSEDETLIQRGAILRPTKIETDISNNKVYFYIDFELIGFKPHREN